MANFFVASFMQMGDIVAPRMKFIQTYAKNVRNLDRQDFKPRILLRRLLRKGLHKAGIKYVGRAAVIAAISLLSRTE